MKIEVGEDRTLTIDGEDASGRHLQVTRRNTGTRISLDGQEVVGPCEVWLRGVLFVSNETDSDRHDT